MESFRGSSTLPIPIPITNNNYHGASSNDIQIIQAPFDFKSNKTFVLKEKEKKNATPVLILLIVFILILIIMDIMLMFDIIFTTINIINKNDKHDKYLYFGKVYKL